MTQTDQSAWHIRLVRHIILSGTQDWWDRVVCQAPKIGQTDYFVWHLKWLNRLVCLAPRMIQTDQSVTLLEWLYANESISVWHKEWIIQISLSGTKYDSNTGQTPVCCKVTNNFVGSGTVMHFELLALSGLRMPVWGLSLQLLTML